MKGIKSIILESNLEIFLHGLKILDLYPGIESIGFLGLRPVSVTLVQVLSAIQVSGSWFHVLGTDPRCPELNFVLIGIYSIQSWTTTTKLFIKINKKKNKKNKKIRRNIYRKIDQKQTKDKRCLSCQDINTFT